MITQGPVKSLLFAIRHVTVGLFAMIQWIFIACIISGISSLRLTSLDVPQSVTVGKGVRLTCAYELEGDVLYSVKWYRDDMEFYRFVPSDRPPGQFFPLQGIKVDVDQSNNGTVYLRDVSSLTAGVYRCEVSADAPSFQTVAADRTMYVNANNRASQRPSHLILFQIATFTFVPMLLGC